MSCGATIATASTQCVTYSSISTDRTPYRLQVNIRSLSLVESVFRRHIATSFHNHDLTRSAEYLGARDQVFEAVSRGAAGA